MPRKKKATDGQEEQPPIDAAATAAAYARDVVSGREPACKLVRLACQRHLTDLRTGKARDLYFSKAHAQHVVDFAVCCRHPEGPHYGERIDLQRWQVFILAVVFGWRTAEGNRRFKIAYIEVPRKNGKSTLLAIVALYLTVADGEAAAKVYSAATTFDQGRIVWDIANTMVGLSPVLQEEFAVSDGQNHASLWHHPTRSTFRPLHAKQRSNEGKNIHGAIVDELHAHPNNKMWTVIRYGTGARANGLVFAITTAGDDLVGVCYQQRQYGVQVLEGAADADHFFAIAFTLDDDDDWQQPANWRKANPNWGVSVIPATLEADFKDAMGIPEDREEFKRKRLGLWVGAEVGYYDRAEWRACAKPEIKLEDVADWPVYAGMDMARIGDIAAVVWTFTRELEGTRTIHLPGTEGEDGELLEVTVRKLAYHLVPWLYLPGAALRDKKNKNQWLYESWHQRGLLRVTDGNAVDYLQIKADILAFRKKINLIRIGYDERLMHQMAQELETEGVEMVKVVQNAQTMNLPMQEFGALMRDRLITHDGNEVFSWMVGNVVGHRPGRAAPKYLQPGKKDGAEHNKIDGPVAAMMAIHSTSIVGDETIIPSGFQLLTV